MGRGRDGSGRPPIQVATIRSDRVPVGAGQEQTGLAPNDPRNSVWRGPTQNIVSHHRGVFENVSFALPTPGEHTAARLGPPDLLFFALYLAAADRFRLRVFWTWVALTLSFGATLAIAYGTDIGGLPALPGLSIAFLVVNADRLWPVFRRGWSAVRTQF